MIREIKDRVNRGELPGGAPLPDYSRSYALYRQQIGRSPVDDKLYLTGQMMGSLNVLDHDGKHVIIGFVGQRTRGGPDVKVGELLTKQGRRNRRSMTSTQKLGRQVARAQRDYPMNADVAFDLDRRGWVFFTLTPEEWMRALGKTWEEAKAKKWI
jgi:hypothetical protein